MIDARSEPSMPVYAAHAGTKTPIPGRQLSRWNNIGARRPHRANPSVKTGSRLTGDVLAQRSGTQNRVRMPIVPTIWFAVLDAPPDVLMNAW